MRLPFLFALGLVVGCDATGDEFRPKTSDAPPILDLGELPVITEEEWSAEGFDPTDPASGVVYQALGASADPSVAGGATFQFKGNGGTYCVVMDPETLYWNVSLGSGGAAYKYVDNYNDDGDLDMDIGLSAYYTGSPGVEMGDFKAVYTDDGGVDHTLEFNECFQGGYNGDSVHAGRGTVEGCEIDTDQRDGIMFTAALKTFSLPVDDSKLGFAVGVFELPDGRAPSCDDLALPNRDKGLTECLFLNEGTAGEDWEHSGLETAYCEGTSKVNDYCEEHMGDENPPCSEPSASADPT